MWKNQQRSTPSKFPRETHPECEIKVFIAENRASVFMERLTSFCLVARRADTQRTPRLTGSWSRSPRASARLQGSVRSTVEWDVFHPPQQQKWRLSLATGHIQIGPIRYEDRHYQIF